MYPVLPSANTRRHPHAVHLDASSSHHSGSNKRSSSMIFRIEHLLPVATAMAPELIQSEKNITAATSSQITSANSAPKRARPQARCGVYVAQFTPKDTLSETFSTLSVMSIGAPSAMPCEHTAYCSLSNDTLCMTPSILRRIKLSEDIHSYNALFEIHNGNVRVRVIRDIDQDAELVAWFGEEATLLMSIPFLTPMNIQGNNRYTCHLCHLIFETPNPLKIHLALGCGRHSIDILWMRLHYALKSATFDQLLPSGTPLSLASTNSTTTPTATYETPSAPISHVGSSLPNISISSPSPPRLSAFRPISLASMPVSHAYSTAPPPPPVRTITTAAASASVHSHSTSRAFMHAMHASSVLPPHLSLLQGAGSGTHPLNAAAQIEAIVSNMGASKQGHLCIYCGKVYSRKYGLKIHIRTHTGFKPLKCKYCLRPFGDPSNLNKHVRLHLQAGMSAGAGGEANEGDPSTTTNECYKCQFCRKTLARRRDLQRHMESRHGQASQRPQSK